MCALMVGRRLGLALLAGGLMAAQPMPEQEVPEQKVPEQKAPESKAPRRKIVETAGGEKVLLDEPPKDPSDEPPVPQAIVRGKFVGEGGAPWQVQIYTTIALSADDLAADRALDDENPRKRFYEYKSPLELDHVCGAVLIAQGWALSAAHCFVSSREALRPLASRRARQGHNYLPLASEMAIERVIVHGDYRRSGDKRHDIALIRLVADAATNTAVAARAKPVRWRMDDADRLADGERTFVTGWGVTGERMAGPGSLDVEGRVLRTSLHLMYAELRTVPMARCRAVSSYRPTVGDARAPFEGVLCVAGDETEQDSCQGDSGGPLTRERPSSIQLIGLVSSGHGCGLEGVPALYTKVSHYEDWITATMKSSKPGEVTRCALKPWLFARRLFGQRLACDD